MPRPRVLSFMSQWANGPRSPSQSAPNSPIIANAPTEKQPDNSVISQLTPSSSSNALDALARDSTTPQPRQRGDSRPSSRPASMLFTYQPPIMDVAQDTLPELQPIFTYLNSHANKLYQEGYFLKLHDLDTRGRPSTDRQWVECFAQLVGTVLSLWDASALDMAGEDGEVTPMFINLSDASIKMIESLPMNGPSGESLQNVLSVSTAAANRYLFHFNSLNSLTQWTAGIRLAMFEHASLQEAYTGSIIAGKGKHLNNIRAIMDRQKWKSEDWVRVRFGPGTPWRRCWCVISPPDEKEFAKASKEGKKKSIYARTVLPKGKIDFYELRKVGKKTVPIATIVDAFSAFAIYPQSKPLIDQSTLIKMEGRVRTYSPNEQIIEGSIFLMPEVHPAVTGFEMMLRFLFPCFDNFQLYGRPSRLVADVFDTRSLMFAMPTTKRYGYLDILDVSGLIHTNGSTDWSEERWRKEMKLLTAKRMKGPQPSNGYEKNSRPGSVATNHRNVLSKANIPTARTGRTGRTGDAPQSTPSSRRSSPAKGRDPSPIAPPRRVDTAPMAMPFSPPAHTRSSSDMLPSHQRYQSNASSHHSFDVGPEDSDETPPIPPQHGHAGYLGDAAVHMAPVFPHQDRESPYSEGDQMDGALVDIEHLSVKTPPPASVDAPPPLMHHPSERPPNALPQAQPPQLIRAKSDFDEETMRELRDANSHVEPDTPIGWKGTAFPEEPMSRQEFARGIENQHGQNSKFGGRSLPTIPASPYVDDTAAFVTDPRAPPAVPAHRGQYFDQQSPLQPPFEASGQRQQQQQPPTNHREHSSFTAAAASENPPLSDAQVRPGISERPVSSSNIKRKPVGSTNSPLRQTPQTPPVLQDEPEAEPPSPSVYTARESLPDDDDLRDLGEYAWGPEHLARLRSLDSTSAAPPQRTMTLETASSATPDYASVDSEQLREQARPVERQRFGRLKTVGRLEEQPSPAKSVMVGETTYTAKPQQATAATIETDVPTIDFGPTYALDPRRASTIDPSTPGSNQHARNKSSGSWMGAPSPHDSNKSGDASNPRASYFGGEGVEDRSRSRSRSPGRELAEMSERPASMAWQPNPSARSKTPTLLPGSNSALSPEQWVAARAAQAAMMRSGQYAAPHHRNDSRTPPMEGADSRTEGGFRRPSSRGANYALQPGAQTTPPLGSPGAVLSAREQEHVARATGAPLIHLNANARQRQSQMVPDSQGLVGTIKAREQERAAVKAGQRSASVQQAIQRQMMEQEVQARRQSQVYLLQQQQHFEEQQRRQQEQQMREYEEQVRRQQQQAIYQQQIQQQATLNQTQRMQMQQQAMYQQQQQAAMAQQYSYQSPAFSGPGGGRARPMSQIVYSPQTNTLQRSSTGGLMMQPQQQQQPQDNRSYRMSMTPPGNVSMQANGGYFGTGGSEQLINRAMNRSASGGLMQSGTQSGTPSNAGNTTGKRQSRMSGWFSRN